MVYEITKISLLMFVCLLAGCGKQQSAPKPTAIVTGAANLSDWRIMGTASATTTPVIMEESWAAALRVKAAKMGLRWSVWCSSTGDRESYTAMAQHLEAPEFAAYIEDGAKDEWIVDGRTRELAGRALLRALDRPAHFLAEHRPDDSPQVKKHCLREVSGGYKKGDKLATSCKDCADDSE